MTIHIYFKASDIKDRNLLTLGLDDALKAVSEKQETIHTTELRIINEKYAEIYDYVFHYNGEEVFISKEEIGEDWFYNIITILQEKYENRYAEFESLSKEMFQYAIKTRNYILRTLEYEKKKDEEFKKIHNVFQYIRFRIKEILNDKDWMYIGFICCTVISILINPIIGEKIATAIAAVLLITFNEWTGFSRRRKSK